LFLFNSWEKDRLIVKFRGGFNIPLSGKPDDKVSELPAPAVLRLPLSGIRFSFNEILVKDGDQVVAGQILARDADNHGVPLLASLDGKVSVSSDRGWIEISVDCAKSEDKTSESGKTDKASKSIFTIDSLVNLGVWSSFYLLDTASKGIPSPKVKPDSILVSPFRPGFFHPTAKAVLKDEMESFVDGLKGLNELFEGVEIIVVLPESKTSTFVVEVETSIKGCKGVKILKVPPRYPFGELLTTSEVLKLKKNSSSVVLGLYASGVIAVGKAKKNNIPHLNRVVSLAGPAVKEPSHYLVPMGYPLDELSKGRLNDGETRFVKGGVLSGTTISDLTLGLDLDTDGVTVLEEHTKRAFLSFLMPGFDRSSYVPSFLGNFIKPREGKGECLNTAVRGEVRPCVSCGYCEEVCPVGIMPYYLHRLLYQDELEQVEKAQIDKCTSCGICTYVCPSKIELSQQFKDGRKLIATELHGEEEEA
jgi:Na(+)-translocating NADH:ubiquinone oxidoreductase A subunit